MMKVRLSFLFILLSLQQMMAGEWHVGICGAVNASGVKTDYPNIYNLPSYHGGISFMYGLHVNYRFLEVLDLEMGVNKVTKGFSYQTIASNNLPSVQYTTINTITTPFTFYLNIPIGIARVAVGAGLAYSYAYNGKIEDEAGNVKDAGFSNAYRDELSGHLAAKLYLFKHFELIFSKNWGMTNVVKSGSGYVTQDWWSAGIGLVL
jgi:hypothetical protein